RQVVEVVDAPDREPGGPLRLHHRYAAALVRVLFEIDEPAGLDPADGRCGDARRHRSFSLSLSVVHRARWCRSGPPCSPTARTAPAARGAVAPGASPVAVSPVGVR